MLRRGGKEFHVIVAECDGVDAAGADRAPPFLGGKKGGHLAATWADAQKRDVFVSDAKPGAVRQLL